MQSSNFTGNRCTKIVPVILALCSNAFDYLVLDSMIVRLITCVIVKCAKLAELILLISSTTILDYL